MFFEHEVIIIQTVVQVILSRSSMIHEETIKLPFPTANTMEREHYGILADTRALLKDTHLSIYGTGTSISI